MITKHTKDIFALDFEDYIYTHIYIYITVKHIPYKTNKLFIFLF